MSENDLTNVMGSFIKTEIESFEELDKELTQKDKEIERLHSIIKEVREYIENHKEPLHHYWDEPDCDYWIATNPQELLQILDKEDNV